VPRRNRNYPPANDPSGNLPPGCSRKTRRGGSRIPLLDNDCEGDAAVPDPLHLGRRLQFVATPVARQYSSAVNDCSPPRCGILIEPMTAPGSKADISKCPTDVRYRKRTFASVIGTTESLTSLSGLTFEKARARPPITVQINRTVRTCGLEGRRDHSVRVARGKRLPAFILSKRRSRRRLLQR
jgi:hypothetical protein